MILKFLEFINEKISVSTTDKPSIASDINNLNNLEGFIEEFNNKKTTLQNIYMTARDEKDLINKLSASQFIDSTTNKSQMKFKNPLLGKYSTSCDYNKQILDLENEQKEIEISVGEKQSQVGPNPTLRDSLTQDIQSKKTDISRIKARISEIKSESERIERLTMKDLEEMRKQIIEGTGEVKKGREEIIKGSL
jgi:septal ring factor EnvC (AmiA/AmiB activator)